MLQWFVIVSHESLCLSRTESFQELIEHIWRVSWLWKIYGLCWFMFRQRLNYIINILAALLKIWRWWGFLAVILGTFLTGFYPTLCNHLAIYALTKLQLFWTKTKSARGIQGIFSFIMLYNNHIDLVLTFENTKDFEY